MNMQSKKAITYTDFKLDVFTTLTKQEMTAYTKVQLILSPMCIFVCEVPAGSTCLSFLSVCISVLDSTGGLNAHPRSNTNNNKDFI